MARMIVEGFEEQLKKLDQLTTNTKDIASDVIYEGAAVVANAIKANIQALPVQQKYAGKGEMLTGITSAQKAGLLAGFGIASMRKTGTSYDRKLGFDGYNAQKTTKYPGGQPNSMIARAVCSGTSFRAKNDFVGRAVRSKKSDAVNKMQKKFEETLNKLMG